MKNLIRIGHHFFNLDHLVHATVAGETHKCAELHFAVTEGSWDGGEGVVRAYRVELTGDNAIALAQYLDFLAEDFTPNPAPAAPAAPAALPELDDIPF